MTVPGETAHGFLEVLQALGVGRSILVLIDFSTGAAAFAAVYALFDKLESIASADAKRDIAAWLRHADVPRWLAHWPKQFIVLFDRVFGRNHFSSQCFISSSIASIAAVAITTLLWIIIFREAFMTT